MATRSTAPRVTASTRHAARTSSEPGAAGTGGAGAGVASNAMPVTDFYSASSLEEHKEQIYAVVTVALSLIVARLVDRWLARRGRSISVAVAGGELSAVATTRLRLVRRLVFAGIIILGLAVGLAQFDGVRRLATAILASSAVLGLVVGFAARATLANGVAGIMLAITQPIRIGDLVTFEEQTGRGGGREAHLHVHPPRRTAAAWWCPTSAWPRARSRTTPWWIRACRSRCRCGSGPDADADRAIELIEAEEDGITAARGRVREGRCAPERHHMGRRDRGSGAPRPPTCAACWLRRLREHGLSSAEAS